MSRVRVLVVDDSAFARKVMRESLSKSGEFEVVGTAGDGLEALEKIAELDPDVVTLDLVMPNLDGVGVLQELAASRSRARVVVVSMSAEDSELAVLALQLGAVQLVRKPTALASDKLYELGDALEAAVRLAANAQLPAPVPAVPPQTDGGVPTHVELVVVGTSTGGPQALARLLSVLPAAFPVPVAIALHIPREYTDALARRLDAQCALRVLEASEGLELRRGQVVLAQGGCHLVVERSGVALRCRIEEEPGEGLYQPSVDVLFRTAAEATRGALLGVVLTGMGDDGLKGARAIAAAGGRVLTEAASSSVIYGMPRVVREAGLSSAEAPIETMAAEVMRWLQS